MALYGVLSFIDKFIYICNKLFEAIPRSVLCLLENILENNEEITFWIKIIYRMIRKGIRSLLHRNLNPFATQLNKPILYGNNKSIISVSQWWNGSLPRPNDYYVEDTLETEICEDWSLSKGMFRVVFSACLNDPSMNININHLKRSFFLNQLIQLSGSEK